MAEGTIQRAMVAVLLVVMALAAPAGAAQDVAALEERLERARRQWDVSAVTEVLSLARGLEGEEAWRLRAAAGLTQASVLRVEHEQTPEAERETRRVLGSRIDVAAEEALGLLDRLPESSERERMRADLLATMIRSDFRAQKYRGRLDAAIDRALELDPDNPRALVSAAKPLVFAPEGQGRDLEAAVDRLDRALEIAPGLEAALLLRAEARRRLGDAEAARADWRRALEANPDSQPARWALDASGPDA